MGEGSFADDERTALLEAIEESLRPLMRAAFAYGVTYHDLIEVVRALYIFTQRERNQSQGRSTDPTRLGLMAGVTRGEVVKMVNDREERDLQRAQAAKRFDQLTQLLGRWHDDPRFSTPYGAPLDLSLQPEGAFRVFDDLLKASGTELQRDEAIAALCSTKCVEVHAGKFIRCTSRSFLPAGKDLSRIARIGRVSGALNSTFVHNLLRAPDQASYFERTMVADFPLSEKGRDLMLANLGVDAEDFIEGMDKWVSTRAADYMDADGRRYGVTAFFFEDTSEQSGQYAMPQVVDVLAESPSQN